ncbi:DMT family transporter [Vitreoscilla massiliensis]|uniref:DMT family transporter n=1 Tax=Vitreoscilla massiliensis TaxID=1689272 RepID=A0ABY4E7C2_9NEIS|nr:DMT family transporter [Vitreoscilla massiliensis]UOO91236.1 DMT family transporter [Vitreoscilla massiliensis]
MIIAAVFFAIMGALVKLGADHYSSEEMVFYRTIFSVVVLAGLALMRGETLKSPHLKQHISRGIAGTLGILAFFYALTRLPLATAVTLNYTSPIFLAVLSFFLLKERISRRTMAVLVLGFIGVMILLRPSLGGDQFVAGLVGLSAGVFAGWAYLQVRELALLGEAEWRVVLYFSVVASVISAVIISFQGWHAPRSLQDVLILGGVGLTALVAQMSMTRAYKVGRKFVVASFSYLTVVFSTLLGVWWFGEILHVQELTGIAVIVLSGILGSILPLKK